MNSVGVYIFQIIEMETFHFVSDETNVLVFRYLYFIRWIGSGRKKYRKEYKQWRSYELD